MNPPTLTLPEFKVTETKREIRIEWCIPGMATLTEFLYWAFDQGARYELRLSVPPKYGEAEIVALSGTAGEYVSGLYFDHGTFYRAGFPTIHYLVHHGLDGLPINYLLALPTDAPIFSIQTAEGGACQLSLDELGAHYYDHSKNLRSMLIAVTRDGVPQALTQEGLV